MGGFLKRKTVSVSFLAVRSLSECMLETDASDGEAIGGRVYYAAHRSKSPWWWWRCAGML